MDTCIHLSKVVKTFRSGNGSGFIRAVDALLDRGRIVADTPTREIRAGGVQRTVSARFAPHVLNTSQQQLAALPYVSGVRVNADRLIISTSDSDRVARTILDALDGHDLEIQHESLEDAFVALTTAGATA